LLSLIGTTTSHFAAQLHSGSLLWAKFNVQPVTSRTARLPFCSTGC
jgi:hypothetical protein